MSKENLKPAGEPQIELNEEKSETGLGYTATFEVVPEVNVGEFDALQNDLQTKEIVFKEHPLSRHYNGQQEPRKWLTNTSGYHRSFFAFWKKCKKELEW